MANVLLIDDDPDIRMLARMTLEFGGNEVTDAANGLRGLDLLRRAVEAGKPPVVVLDVQMPDIDGWEVLSRIRDDDALETVPVLMCTVRAGALDRERGYGLGADAFQAKPFDLDQLLDTVNMLATLDRDRLLNRREQMSMYIAGDEEARP